MASQTSHTAYCSVDGCNANIYQGNISFFRCPTDPVRCERWKEVLGFTGEHRYAKLTHEIAFKRIRICSAHFDDKSFTASRKRLLKTAIPSKLLSPMALRLAGISDNANQDSVISSNANLETPSTSSATPCGLCSCCKLKSIDVVKSDASTQTGAFQEFKEELLCQTRLDLLENVPGEQKLKKHIFNLRSTLKVSHNKMDITREDVLQFLNEMYSQEAAMLIKSQLLLLDKKPEDTRYSNEFKHFALTLYLLGPMVYKKLSESIKLPSKATLSRIIRYWKVYPGFNEFIFKILEVKVPLMPEKAKDCILCIDEMPIKSNLFYNISTDAIIGFENFNKKSNNIATSCLVLMARTVSHSWKQPIAYFFAKSSTDAGDLKEIIFQSIRKLKNIGLNVLAITSDQGPKFYKLVKNTLKLTIDTPYFCVDDSPVLYLFDVPHLLKSTRNNFFSYNFILGDGIAKKEYLVTTYQLDKTKKFRLAPRLTDEHLFPNNFRKFKVTLASQVFSHSVAVAMYTYIEFEKLPMDAKVTANFIENMNKLFDMFNSSNQETSEAFVGTKDQFEFLYKMDKMFSNLTVLDQSGKNVTNTLKFIYGWRLTISSVIKLWKTLARKNYRFLLTRHVNLDCLDNFFCQIRNACGNTRNPTPIQFCRAFKKLFTLKILDETKSGNCLEDAADILLTMTPELLKKSEWFQISKNDNLQKILKVKTNDYLNLKTGEQNACIYMASYFLRKCLIKHSCDVCLNYCNTTGVEQSNGFCQLKVYQGSQGSFGGLTVPPNDFIDFILSLENIFLINFKEVCIQNGVGNILLNKMSYITFSHPCEHFPLEYLHSLYIRVRIYYTLKFANREIKSKKYSKENPKLRILQNL